MVIDLRSSVARRARTLDADGRARASALVSGQTAAIRIALQHFSQPISSPSSGAHAYSQLRARMHESCMHILDPLRSDHALYARTSTARTMHVWAAPYKMYEAPYIPPYMYRYMTGNFRPTAQIMPKLQTTVQIDSVF